jgi:cytochrome c oxidase subunit 2
MPRLPRPRSGRRLWGAGLLVVLASLLSACADEAPQSTFDAEGPAANQIADLSNLTFGIAAVVFVFVEVGVLFVVWKFRRRKDDHDDDVPAQLHGNTKAEIGWTALPAVILVGLAIPTVSTVLDLADEPADAIHIRVVGQQWWWSYDYDIDGDGVYADDDVNAEGIEAPDEYATDIETANEMVIPAGVPVYLTIESRDVIHSYWIPNLNGKKDAVPGRTHNLTLEAYEPGTYIGQCTEYCGLSHAYMRQSVRALPMDEYEAWVENQLEEAAGELATKGAEIFEAQCTSCHLVEGVNDDGYDGAAQTSGASPNLTHFASRGIYAGGIFNLWSDTDGDEKLETEEIGQQLERNQLEAWLRNPPAEKPLAPVENRGMPDLGLSEADIDALVAYLTSLE